MWETQGLGFESLIYLSPGLIHRQFYSYVHTQEKHIESQKLEHVHHSIIYDSRKAETTQISIKYKARYPHWYKLLPSHERKPRSFNMDVQTLKALL